MKISIIPSDLTVYLDGKGFVVPNAGRLSRFQAIQWDGEEGHVEYVQVKGEDYIPNEKITTISAFQTVINEAIKMQEETPVQPTEVPLDIYTYKVRQRYAFTIARTANFGVQYSDPLSIGMLTALVALFDKGMLTGSINYKGPNGFISLTGEEIGSLAGEVAMHVQKYFNTEKNVLEQVAMGTITTHAQIDAVFLGVK